MENNIKVSPSHELLEELKTAVFNCDIEAVEASLRKGAKCNLPYNHQIELFLKHGADINSKKNLTIFTKNGMN